MKALWTPRIWTIASPLGPLLAVTSKRGLCRLSFAADAAARATLVRELSDAGMAEGDLADHPDQRVDRQLEEYFQHRRKAFDLPLDLRLAPPFCRARVLPALCLVPYGSTLSYADLAQRAGRPRGARSVGQAVRRNPLAIVIPCHRVISADGSLGGFSPDPALKRQLLAHEGARIRIPGFLDAPRLLP